jgi:hypothetical protein
MATPVPDAPWGLLAVDPGMAERLEVVVLCEVGLSFVCFSLYNDVKEVAKSEDML